VALMGKDLEKAKTGANAIGFVVAVLFALVCVNAIATRLFARVDCTQDHVYTLSPASRELVAKLPDRLTVKAYISNDLQPPFSQVGQYVRDLLSEYASASKGKLKWEAIDPSGDKTLEDEATKLKVPKMRRGRVSSNKVEIGASYLGVALEYQGNVESIPEINSPEGLEFQMSSLIKMMTVKKKKIAFATSEGELSTTGDPQRGGPGLQMMHQYMADFEVVPVTLTTGAKPIPDDVDALVIAGPKQPFNERAKFVIDQFLMRGKSVAFFVDGMVIETPRGMQLPGQAQPQIGRKNDVALDDLLEHYGFKIKDNMVLEPRQNVPGPVPVQGQLFLANYPTFVAATEMDKKSTITDHLQAVILPFASSVEQIKDKQPGATYTNLIKSTGDAWEQSNFFLFDPQNNQLKVGDVKGPFVLAAAAQGKLKSFFAGKPYPNEKGEKVSPPTADTSAAPGPDGEARPLDESAGTARIVVVGDSDFASDEYVRFARQIPTYAGNLLFFMNVLDHLAQDEALAPIRAKGMTARPLTFGSDASPTAIKYANIVGVPLLFIAFGIARWQMRNNRRRNARL
jgi:ABC-type uncharacterized transport system involved in gliding motility auxiliary subunit